LCPIKELTVPRHKGRHNVDATKVSLLNDDVTKIFDILLSIAMHYGKTFIPPLVAITPLVESTVILMMMMMKAQGGLMSLINVTGGMMINFSE